MNREIIRIEYGDIPEGIEEEEGRITEGLNDNKSIVQTIIHPPIKHTANRIFL